MLFKYFFGVFQKDHQRNSVKKLKRDGLNCPQKVEINLHILKS